MIAEHIVSVNHLGQEKNDRDEGCIHSSGIISKIFSNLSSFENKFWLETSFSLKCFSDILEDLLQSLKEPWYTNEHKNYREKINNTN